MPDPSRNIRLQEWEDDDRPYGSPESYETLGFTPSKENLLDLSIRSKRLKATSVVGVDWLLPRRGSSGTICVKPKFPEMPLAELFLRVQNEISEGTRTARSKEPSPFRQELFAFRLDEPAIPLTSEEFSEELVLFQVAAFVKVVYELLRRKRKVEYRIERQNLSGKVKGKILTVLQIKRNLAQGRMDRAWCQFCLMDVDHPINQVLKAGLHRARHSLEASKHGRGAVAEGGGDWNSLFSDLRFCEGELEGVKLLRAVPERIYTQCHFTGLYRDYEEAFKLARVILKTITLSVETCAENYFPSTTVPFRIDMNLLFELFVRAAFRSAGWIPKRSDNEKVFEESDRGENPVPQFRPDVFGKIDNLAEGFVVEVKYYKENWYKNLCEPGFSREEKDRKEKSRQGLFQLMAYMLAFERRVGVVVYPVTKEKNEELHGPYIVRAQGEAEEVWHGSKNARRRHVSFIGLKVAKTNEMEMQLKRNIRSIEKHI